jgi:hypothetical protein
VSIQQMLLVSNSATDPYFSSRVSIANLNTNLTDAKGKVWTANGNANVSGGWLNLDGTGDYLATPNSTDFDFAAGDFALEAFINLAVTPGAEMTIASKWQSGSLSWLFGINASRRVFLYTRIAGTNRFSTGTNTVTVGADAHIAAYRVSSLWYVAINGVVQSILTNAGSIEVTSQQTCIGTQSDGSMNAFNGKVRGFRATKGGAGGYGATNFTPPSFPLPTS